MPGNRRSLAAAAAFALHLLAAPGLASAQYGYGAIALGGEAAPGTGGASYVNGFQDVAVNAAGRVAFLAELSGGTASWGAFLHDAGTTAPVALGGDTAPDTGGGSYFLPGGFVTLNALDEVTFVAAVLGGSVSTGLFRAAGGTHQSVVLPGDPAPGTGVGSFSAFSSASEGNGGHAAFAANVAGGSATSGLFQNAGGTTTALVLAGDTAPDSGGGVFTDFLVPASNGSGSVVFLSNLTGSTPTGGIFLSDGAATLAVALEGDVAPQTGGGTYAVIPSPAAINDLGDVVLPAALAGGSAAGGVFLRDGASGELRPVVLAGAPAPTAGGESFAAFDRVAINDAGQVAFLATLSNGDNGVFLATPAAAVPALGRLGHAALVALLAATALAATSRRFRRR
jgi:hypothetical protein